jgi:hypothetical protein
MSPSSATQTSPKSVIIEEKRDNQERVGFLIAVYHSPDYTWGRPSADVHDKGVNYYQV